MEQTQSPLFSAKDQSGTLRRLSEFKEKQVLLYFYPKDMTPGCTIETLGFQELKSEFEKENTIIIGISKDPVSSHQKFCEKHNLDIILLADIDTEIIKKYNVWKEKSMFGKKYIGTSRESFLINTSGKIIKHWKTVKPITHPKEVLAYIQSLKK